MRMLKNYLIVIALLLFVAPAFAQSNDLAVTVGGYFPINSQIPVGNSFAIQGNFGHRIFHAPLASLFVEIPVTGTFNSDVFTTGHLLSLGTYSAVFVTPGVRLKLAPGSPLSPYLAIGGGLAHFSKSGNALATSSSTNAGTFDFAGGLEMKIFPYLSLRGEVRDYYSGSPNLLPGADARQNQLLATGGIVFRF